MLPVKKFRLLLGVARPNIISGALSCDVNKRHISKHLKQIFRLKLKVNTLLIVPRQFSSAFDQILVTVYCYCYNCIYLLVLVLLLKLYLCKIQLQFCHCRTVVVVILRLC